MKIQNDCFADKGYHRCLILNTKDCEKCNFKKTHEQYVNDRTKYIDKEKYYFENKGITYKEFSI